MALIEAGESRLYLTVCLYLRYSGTRRQWWGTGNPGKELDTLCKKGAFALALNFALHLEIHKPDKHKHIHIHLLPRLQAYIMASNSKDSAFNILGSSKLNTADGKNPTSYTTTSTSTQPGTTSDQKNSEEYRQECSKAHNLLEDRLRDEVCTLLFDI